MIKYPPQWVQQLNYHLYCETKLYSETLAPIVRGKKSFDKRAHFDTTSLTVYGEL